VIAPTTLRQLMADTDVLVAARRVDENDVPVTQAALRGAIRRVFPTRSDLDALARAAMVQYRASKVRSR
jgi:hypothetical protein